MKRLVVIPICVVIETRSVMINYQHLLSVITISVRNQLKNYSDKLLDIKCGEPITYLVSDDTNINAPKIIGNLSNSKKKFTTSEKRVLEGLIHGMSELEISEKMGVSRSRVTQIIRRIVQKMGYESVKDMMRQALLSHLR